jgi:hypothetical protein
MAKRGISLASFFAPLIRLEPSAQFAYQSEGVSIRRFDWGCVG